MNPFLRVFLKSSVGEIELSTHDHTAPFKVLDGARGLGLPERSVESTPIPSAHGSVFRSQRFDASEVFLPIAMVDKDASRVAERARALERMLMVDSDDPIELRVEAPELGTVRRRFVYYTEGLEGAIGGNDSHFSWRHVGVKLQALDPLWYGDERVLSQRVDVGRKPFLTGAQSVQLRRNLFWDGGSDYGSSTWIVHGVRDTAVKKSGAASRRLDANGSNFLYAYAYSVVAGAVHSFGFELKATAGISHVQVKINMGATARTEVFPVGIDWARITISTGITVNDAMAVTLTPGIQSGGQFQAATTGQLWVDEGIFEASQTVGPYFDGDTQDSAGKSYGWEGMPGNSVSVETLDASPRAIPFFPVILAGSTVQGAFEFNISGDTDAWPIWTITGPGEDLLIQNDITGERIFIRGEFSEQVVIDTRPTVADIYSTSAADGELWSRVDDDYTLFPLRRGENRIRITMVNARPDSQVKLSYSETWLAGW